MATHGKKRVIALGGLKGCDVLSESWRHNLATRRMKQVVAKTRTGQLQPPQHDLRLRSLRLSLVRNGV